MAPKYEQLTGMSKADLIAAYNEESPNVMVGLEWFRSSCGAAKHPLRQEP